MAGKEGKLTTRKIRTNDQANYYSGITSITVNGKNVYELEKKFLDDLHKNAFSGTHGEDAVEHIEYFLKIVDPINLPNVNQDKLRIVVFPISLAGDVWRWFDGIKGSITSWVDFCAKFFGKYYPPSRTGKVETLIIKWDPTNPKFENWLASKFVYYQNYGYIYTKGALWEYWKLGSDEIKPTNEETADLEETNHDNEQEIGEIFRIETKLFDYETPLCEKFKKIEGFKTYEEYKDDWIYEWNENVPWVHEITIDCGKKKTIYFGVWTEPTLVVHYSKPFNYKSGYSEWPTYSWKEDGHCNRGNLPGAYIVGKMLRY
ncbi:hypothetical protein Tco_0844390 [Tanacetum coccineum]